MAATADRNTRRLDVGYVEIPVATLTKLYAGTLVAVDASGNAIAAVDSSIKQVVGVAMAQADNSAGLAGAINVKVEFGRSFWLANTDLTDANRGGIAYVDDDITVRAANGGFNNPAGILLDVDATLGALVYIPESLALSGVVAVDLAVGQDLAVTRNATVGGTLVVTGVATHTATSVFSGGLNVVAGQKIDTVAAGALLLGTTTATSVGIGVTGTPTRHYGTTTLSEAVTVTAGGLVVTAGGITVTAGGLTVTAGGVTLTDGDVTITSGRLIMTGLTATDGVQVGYVAAAIAEPPVIANLEAAFGATAAGRNGFTGIVRNTGGAGKVYRVGIANGVWYQHEMTVCGA